MNKRAELQLRLQQTVEGLSVVVLTYYVSGLLGYGLKALKATGLALPVDFIVGVSVPFTLVAALLLTRRVRRRLNQAAISH